MVGSEVHFISSDHRVGNFDSAAHLTEVFHLWIGHNASLVDKFHSSIHRTEAEKALTVISCSVRRTSFLCLTSFQETSFTMIAIGERPSLRNSMVALTFVSIYARPVVDDGGWITLVMVMNGTCRTGSGVCQPGALRVAPPTVQLADFDRFQRSVVPEDKIRAGGRHRGIFTSIRRAIKRMQSQKSIYSQLLKAIGW